MGTSKSDPGPRGGSPLLPPWAPELPPLVDDGPVVDAASASAELLGLSDDADAGDIDNGSDAHTQEDDERTDTLSDPTPWGAPRRLIGSVASGTSTGPRFRRDVGRAAGGVVRALGGPRGATRRAVSGRVAAGRLAAFISAAAVSGATAAAQAFRLDAYLNGPVEVFLEQLVSVIAPDGGLTEEAVSRAAVAETVSDLLDTLDPGATPSDVIDRLTREGVAMALTRCIANYIVQRVLQLLSRRVEDRLLAPARAVVIERQVRAFVHATVAVDLTGRDVTTVAWDGAEGQGLIAQLYVDAFALVEASAG